MESDSMPAGTKLGSELGFENRQNIGCDSDCQTVNDQHLKWDGIDPLRPSNETDRKEENLREDNATQDESAARKTI